MFDIRYQYALETTSLQEQPLYDRTFIRIKTSVLESATKHDVDLIHECIAIMAKRICEFINITPNMQRTNSLMIATNLKIFLC